MGYHDISQMTAVARRIRESEPTINLDIDELLMQTVEEYQCEWGLVHGFYRCIFPDGTYMIGQMKYG